MGNPDGKGRSHSSPLILVAAVVLAAGHIFQLAVRIGSVGLVVYAVLYGSYLGCYAIFITFVDFFALRRYLRRKKEARDRALEVPVGRLPAQHRTLGAGLVEDLDYHDSDWMDPEPAPATWSLTGVVRRVRNYIDHSSMRLLKQMHNFPEEASSRRPARASAAATQDFVRPVKSPPRWDHIDDQLSEDLGSLQPQGLCGAVQRVLHGWIQGTDKWSLVHSNGDIEVLVEERPESYPRVLCRAAVPAHASAVSAVLEDGSSWPSWTDAVVSRTLDQSHPGITRWRTVLNTNGGDRLLQEWTEVQKVVDNPVVHAFSSVVADQSTTDSGIVLANSALFGWVVRPSSTGSEVALIADVDLKLPVECPRSWTLFAQLLEDLKKRMASPGGQSPRIGVGGLLRRFPIRGSQHQSEGDLNGTGRARVPGAALLQRFTRRNTPTDVGPSTERPVGTAAGVRAMLRRRTRHVSEGDLQSGLIDRGFRRNNSGDVAMRTGLRAGIASYGSRMLRAPICGIPEESRGVPRPPRRVASDLPVSSAKSEDHLSWDLLDDGLTERLQDLDSGSDDLIQVILAAQAEDEDDAQILEHSGVDFSLAVMRSSVDAEQQYTILCFSLQQRPEVVFDLLVGDWSKWNTAVRQWTVTEVADADPSRIAKGRNRVVTLVQCEGVVREVHEWVENSPNTNRGMVVAVASAEGRRPMCSTRGWVLTQRCSADGSWWTDVTYVIFSTSPAAESDAAQLLRDLRTAALAQS
mmetsp:Transcript_84173/g.191913  ORF Transcript_84173/g.191913 Transcript_84173/m.191913 type:complete len:747 (-) Transcript_84173:237-2477(-)